LPDVPVDAESYIENAIITREEIVKLENYLLLSGNSMKLNKSSRFPEVFAVIDYGFQGEEYNFGSGDDYMLASIVLKWDIFKGFQEESRINQARIMEEKVNYQLEETLKLIRLDILNCWHDLIAAEKKLAASEANSAAASEAFRIVSKKYGQDLTSLLEYLDARNNMTMAEQNRIINNYDLLIKYAAFEKAAALFDIHNE